MKGTKWMILLCAAMLSCGMTVSAAPFDPAYYAAQNPDVVQALGEDESALELHYNTFGAAEGRAANAQEAAARNAAAQKTGSVVSFEEFDPAYYAEQNPDVTALLGTDPEALYTHYVMFGAAEGRLPKAPEVVDPYARFASSASSSKSSKHSDDDDDDDDSGSAQTHIVYGEKQYEIIAAFLDEDSGIRTTSHYYYLCNMKENCSEHYGTEGCTLTATLVSDDKHRINCSKCGLTREDTHESTWMTKESPDRHYEYCNICGGSWNEEKCDYYHNGSKGNYTIWCQGHGNTFKLYTHSDDDWDGNGNCKQKGCDATRS